MQTRSSTHIVTRLHFPLNRCRRHALDILPPSLCPANQLLVHRPSERTTNRLTSNPNPQPVKKTPQPFFSNHLLPRLHQVRVRVRHELDPRLDCVERVRDGGAQPSGGHTRDEVYASARAAGQSRGRRRVSGLDFRC